MTDLADRIEQHCRTAFAGTWEVMSEADKAAWRIQYWRIIQYTPAVEAQMEAEEERR